MAKVAKKTKKTKKQKVVDVELKSRLGVSPEGNVLLQFNQKVNVVVLPPEHAIGMAEGLMKCVEVAKSAGDAGKIFGPNGETLKSTN